MPDGDKLVQLPSGEKVQFPASMADADVNTAIEQYLGQQQATGFAARRAAGIGVSPALKQSDAKPTFWDRTGGQLGRGLAGFADWMREGVGNIQGRELHNVATGGTRAPDTGVKVAVGGGMADIADVAGRMISDPKQMALAVASLFPATRIPAGAITAGQSAGDIGGVVQAEHPLTPENIQRALFDLAGITGGVGAAGSGMAGVKSGAQTGMREVMGEGPSKGRLLADQHAHALATKQHLSGVAEAVHTDAQTAMSQVLAKVDEANPGGAFSRADIQTKVSDAVGDLVKVPEKLPASVGKILKSEKQGGWEAAAQSNTAKYISQLREQGLNDAQLKQVLAKEGLSGADIEKGMSGGDKFTAEQLKQMRSDVGQELSRYGRKGVVGAALNKVYGVLSQELRSASAKAGVESDWLEANSKYSQYSNDFLRGPLKRVLGGSTASGVMEPLTGSSRIQLLDTLQKYRDAGFDVNLDTLQEEMRRYGMSRTVNRLSQPTKMDLLMAGFSPKALAIRQLGPRLMRNPKAIDMFAGEGFDTPMSPRQVYPSKAAAMRAVKGGAEPADEAARRGAPSESPSAKSLRRQLEKRRKQE